MRISKPQVPYSFLSSSSSDIHYSLSSINPTSARMLQAHPELFTTSPRCRCWVKCATNGDPIGGMWIVTDRVVCTIGLGTYLHLHDPVLGLDCEAKVIAINWKRIEKQYIIFTAEGCSWTDYGDGTRRNHTVSIAVPRSLLHLSFRDSLVAAFYSFIHQSNTTHSEYSTAQCDNP